MKLKQDTFAPAKVALSDKAAPAVLKGFGVSGADDDFHAVVTKKLNGIQAVEFVIFVKRFYALLLPFYKKVDLSLVVYSGVDLVGKLAPSDAVKRGEVFQQFEIDTCCITLEEFKVVFQASYQIMLTLKSTLNGPEFQYSCAWMEWKARHRERVAFLAQTYTPAPINGLIESLYNHMFFVKGQPPNVNCNVQLGLEPWMEATCYP